MIYRKYIKRLLDIALSFIAIVILLPIFIVIFIILALTLGENPFFIQLRAGLHGKTFKILKFKTMKSKCDAAGKPLPDKDRMTRVGKFLRKTSLDEIPQILNVLLGNMSFIGPRPLLPEYENLYNSQQKRRQLVRPGITGLSGIHRRDINTWTQQFALDVWYVENLSFPLDIKIFFQTFVVVLKREGRNDNEIWQNMEKFDGTN